MSSFTPFRSLLRAANASPSSMLTRSAQRSSPFSTTASNQFSRLTIIGRLGADSELHTTASGREIVKYHVATNYGRGDNRQTSWFHVTHFLPQEANARKDFMLGLQKGFVPIFLMCIIVMKIFSLTSFLLNFFCLLFALPLECYEQSRGPN